MSTKKENSFKESPGKQLLENAYQLKTPEDSRAYYDKLAKHYDEDFVNGLAYQLPVQVQAVFSALATANDSPILDVGCGTGVIGDLLARDNVIMDGADISPAMLAVCEKKGCYRKLFDVDLTQSIEVICNQYGAVVSSGTFTHGHLGTTPFIDLLKVARAGALFVITINKAHYEKLGFSRAIDQLIKDKRIQKLKTDTVNIYADSNHSHSADEGLIVSFRKA